MRSVKDTFILRKDPMKEVYERTFSLFSGPNKIVQDVFADEVFLASQMVVDDYKSKWIAALCCLIYKFTQKEKFAFYYREDQSSQKRINIELDDSLKLSEIWGNIKNRIMGEEMSRYKHGDKPDVFLEFIDGNYLGSNDFESYNLIFKVKIEDNRLLVYIYFNATICTKEYAVKIGHYFLNICESMLTEDHLKLKELKLETEATILRQLKVIHRQEQSFHYQYNFSIPSTFEKNIKNYLCQIAICDEMGTLTYEELVRASNKVANLLTHNGVQKGDAVAIIGSRSRQTMLAILGALKVGAIYVPIDKEIPLSRINYILEDADPKVVILNDYINLWGEVYRTILLNEYYDYSEELNNTSIDGESIAYLLYTSGTTGNPKGVMVKHSSVVNLSRWFGIIYDIKKNRNILHMTNISFDVSVEETISTLLNYGTIYIIPEAYKLDKIKFKKYIDNNQINIAQFVPVTLKELLLDSDKIASLKIVICGGEKLEDNLKNDILKKGYSLYNHYGPTECTVDAVTCRCKFENNYLGKPMANTEVYILNENNDLQPFGVPGELCIAGAGRAVGYWNKPEITNEKFLWHEFLHTMLYKTGDLAYILPDGNVQFIGRIDQQVKLNGVRIELEEIEHFLKEYSGIQEAVVVVSNNNSTRFLAAYYKSELVISSEDLRTYLYKYLPQYMVPNYFKSVNEWPLTPNGKIDKKLLSQYHVDNAQKEYTTPRNCIEKAVERIWKQVLKQSRISTNDKFVNVGGDSLRGTILSNLMKERFKVQIPLTEIFTSTISTMADSIKKMPKNQQIVEDANLILLKRGNISQRNLFLIHAGNGEAEVFWDLCENLHIDFNMWGIRADRFSNYSPRNVTLEEIAENYVSKISKIQPDGEIFLMGWCIGGSIAFETALQLEQRGRIIKFFGMINSFAPDRKFWGDIPEFTVESELNESSKLPFYDEFKERCGNSLSVEDVWVNITNFYKEMRLDVKEIKKCIYDDMDRAIPNFDAENTMALDILYYINVLRTFDSVRALYEPMKKLKAQGYFFRASEEQAANANLWNRYCEKKIKLLDIDGDNFTILRYPKVLQFAELLNNILFKEGIYN